MAVNDDLFALELALAKYPEGTPGSALNRRLILRKALDRQDREGYERGYTDGLRDSSEAKHIEQQIRDQRGIGEDTTDG